MLIYSILFLLLSNAVSSSFSEPLSPYNGISGDLLDGQNKNTKKWDKSILYCRIAIFSLGICLVLCYITLYFKTLDKDMEIYGSFDLSIITKGGTPMFMFCSLFRTNQSKRFFTLSPLLVSYFYGDFSTQGKGMKGTTRFLRYSGTLVVSTLVRRRNKNVFSRCCSPNFVCSCLFCKASSKAISNTRAFATLSPISPFISSLYINSTPNNIVFIHDKSVLMLPSLKEADNDYGEFMRYEFTSSLNEVLDNLNLDNLRNLRFTFYCYIESSIYIDLYNFDVIELNRLNLSKNIFGYYEVFVFSKERKNNFDIYYDLPDYLSEELKTLFLNIEESKSSIVRCFLEKGVLLVIEQDIDKKEGGLNGNYYPFGYKPFNNDITSRLSPLSWSKIRKK